MRHIDLSTWPRAVNGLLRETDKWTEADYLTRRELRYNSFVRFKVR